MEEGEEDGRRKIPVAIPFSNGKTRQYGPVEAIDDDDEEEDDDDDDDGEGEPREDPTEEKEKESPCRAVVHSSLVSTRTGTNFFIPFRLGVVSFSFFSFSWWEGERMGRRFHAPQKKMSFSDDHGEKEKYPTGTAGVDWNTSSGSGGGPPPATAAATVAVVARGGRGGGPEEEACEEEEEREEEEEAEGGGGGRREVKTGGGGGSGVD